MCMCNLYFQFCLAEHIKHLRDASTMDLILLVKMIFDILNLKLTLKNLSLKNKTGRNILLKGIFESVYNVCYS